MKFQFNETQLKVLANFATINQQMLIEPTHFAVMNVSKSVVANFPFDTPFQFDSFGIYDAADFMAVLSIIKKAEIEAKDKYLQICGVDSKFNYYTTAKELVPKVPNTDDIFKSVVYDLDFSLTADKLAVIMKSATQLKAKYIFFETDINNQVRITIGDELEASTNSFQSFITDGITTNNLTEPVRININDFKILSGEYQVSIARKIVKGNNKYFSKWSNLNGCTYFIATEALK